MQKDVKISDIQNKHYSHFLLTGILAFSEIAGAPTTVAIKNQRQEINTSISDIHREFKKARTENDKLIKRLQLRID